MILSTDKPQHPKFKNLTGQKFNRLLVIAYAGVKNGDIYWHCLCQCKKVRLVSGKNLKNRNTQSCGCLHRERASVVSFKHGGTGKKSPSVEYTAYLSAKSRCLNPKNNRFHIYGGRGIEFRFNSFEEFFAELGLRPSKNHSVDRINVNGHYEKTNVRWATRKEQAQNTRRCLGIN